MAKDHVKLNIVNENHKDFDKRYDDEIEMIFGRPAPAPDKNHVTNVIGNNNNVGESDSERTRQPLLEPTRDRQLPPLAGPEIDDLEGDSPKDATPYPGIDDGLLDTADNKPNRPDLENGDHHPELEPGEKHPEAHDDEPAATDGKLPWGHDEPDYPYDANGLTPRFGDSRPVSPIPGVIPDVNTYQQKKNLAQGMMDLALLSANANQLRYVLESSATHPYYYPSLVFISLSIIFQVMVGIGLIMNSRYDVNDHKERCKADKINNMTVLGVFLITIVNVFITSFSVATQQPGNVVFATLPQEAG